MLKRRMIGWQPLATENTYVLTVPGAHAEPEPVQHMTKEPPVVDQPSNGHQAPNGTGPDIAVQPTTTSGSVQNPNVPRRRMAGWQPLSTARDSAPIAAVNDTAATAMTTASADATDTPEPDTETSAAVTSPDDPAPVPESVSSDAR